jgi:hypothetical protein
MGAATAIACAPPHSLVDLVDIVPTIGASFPQGAANFQQGIPRSGHFCNRSNGEEKAYIANFLI